MRQFCCNRIDVRCCAAQHSVLRGSTRQAKGQPRLLVLLSPYYQLRAGFESPYNLTILILKLAVLPESLLADVRSSRSGDRHQGSCPFLLRETRFRIKTLSLRVPVHSAYQHLVLKTLKTVTGWPVHAGRITGPAVQKLAASASQHSDKDSFVLQC